MHFKKLKIKYLLYKPKCPKCLIIILCHTKNTLDYSWRWQTEILGKLEASLEEAEEENARRGEERTLRYIHLATQT